MQIATEKLVPIHVDGNMTLNRVDEVNQNSHTGRRTTTTIGYRVLDGDKLIWTRDGSADAYKSCLTFFNLRASQPAAATF